jgi:hypothetical protein
MTPAKVRSAIRSALRLIWRNTSRKDYINSVRFKFGKKYHLYCEGCGALFAMNEKDYRVLKDGSKSKKKGLVYEVDHIDGNHPFLSLDDLSAYAKTLLNGKLRVLCIKCHKEKTYG